MGTTRQEPRSGRRRLLVAGGIAVALLFLAPYVALFPLVGAFPAEDVRESLPGTALGAMLCVPAQGDAAARPSPPTLAVDRGQAPAAAELLERSTSIYASGRSGALVALDTIDAGDERRLWTLAARGAFSGERLISFLQEAARYYPRCEAPPTDRGVTEAYWAAKGAAVLHHWLFLYEGSLSGNVHAQYGYAIPWTVREILAAASSLGPTSFVRLAWVVLAACGVAYVALFLHVFRGHPRLALLALVLKFFFFSKMGAFGLLLAPGFHWQRELVLLAVPTLLLAGASSGSAAGPSRRWRRRIAAGAALLLCFLAEPTFFLVAASCAAAAALWGNTRAIAGWARAHRRASLLLLALGAAAAVAVLALQASNLAYVAQKLRGDELVVPAGEYVWQLLAVCAAAAGFLAVLRGRPERVLDGAFALVALSASLYYFVTPDLFHFYKFAEYAVPFGVALAASVVERYGAWARSRVARPARWQAAATTVGAAALALAAARDLGPRPEAYWERRIEDASGAPYFQAASYTIGGRVIRADLSERLARHLRAFPASARFDFLVSPFDKYVTFLYDRTNGFGAPDLVGWLDSAGKLERAVRSTAASERPVRVLLDEASLEVDPRLGIQRANLVVGPLHVASKINLKARLRASELAAELLARCAVDDDPAVRGGWRLLRCGPGR